MAAKSITAARALAEQHADEISDGILIGGMTRNEKLVTPSQFEKIKDCIDDTEEAFLNELCEISFAYKSLWKPSKNAKEILYRNGEHVIVMEQDDREIIICITGYFCMPIGANQNYKSFVEGNLLSPIMDEHGEFQFDPYSGGFLVVETAGQVLLPTNNMQKSYSISE